MPRIVRDIQLLVNDDDDHLYGYRLSDGTEVRIGTSADTDGAAAVVLNSGLVMSEVTDYTQITGTGTIVTGPCELAGYDCIVAAGNITIYDGTSTAGAVIVPATALTVGRVEFAYKRALKNGCHVVLSGAATVNVLATAT